VVAKPVAWLGSSLADLRAFPKDARRAAGYQLGRVQQGLLPTDWKPMTAVGAGVIEIRVHTRVEHRVFYIAKFEEAVYILHAFEKQTRQTPQPDIVLARRRLADLLRRRTRKRKVRQPPREGGSIDHKDSTFERQRVSRPRVFRRRGGEPQDPI
jgi:phage-related protein